MWATLTIIAAVVVVLILVIAAVMSTRRKRRHALQSQFRGEYDRAVAEHGSTRDAERELQARAERHEQLNIRPLDEQHRQQFARAWTETQAEFVDRPEAAVARADDLVRQVMQERGYPVHDFDQQVTDLSVEHADVLNHYREAHDVSTDSAVGRANTERLRQGMVHYRALFTALLDRPRDTGPAGRGDGDRTDTEQRSYS
jgi:hypothetical protein